MNQFKVKASTEMCIYDAFDAAIESRVTPDQLLPYIVDPRIPIRTRVRMCKQLMVKYDSQTVRDACQPVLLEAIKCEVDTISVPVHM